MRKRVVSALEAVSNFVERWAGIIVLAGMLLLTGLGFVVLKLVETQKTQVKTIALVQRELHSQVQNEATSRSEQTAATVNARFANCESGNTLRKALRVNVEQGQRSLPLLLELLPQLDTPRVLRLNQQSVEYQIKAFKLLDCKTYSEEILPGHSP